jgi:hypothetical protein
MQGSQLELDLRLAIADPPAANLHQLWKTLEQSLESLSQDQQLQVAGNAISQIAEVVCGRAQLILDGLERSYLAVDLELGLEPCLSREFLEPFIRQTMSLNLDPLVVLPTPRHRENGIQSAVGGCDKEVLLQILDEEQIKMEALGVAHSEAVQDWINQLNEFFSQHPSPAAFNELVQSLQMDWVEVWMGLLMGQFQLEQRGDFYDGTRIKVFAS